MPSDSCSTVRPKHKADSAAFDAAIDVVHRRCAADADARAALIASLPETISERVRGACLDGGVIPLQGQREALEALALAGAVGGAWRAGPGVQLQLPRRARRGLRRARVP